MDALDEIVELLCVGVAMEQHHREDHIESKHDENHAHHAVDDQQHPIGDDAVKQ